MTAGTPQGAVLSPFLFNLYVNDLKDNINVDRVSVHQFADDIETTVKGGRKRQLEIRLQQSIDQVEAWSKRWRIKLNTGKTKVLYFTNKKKDKTLRVRVGDQVVESTQSARFLGVDFRNDGNGCDHAKRIIAEANKRRRHIFNLARNGIVPVKHIVSVYKAYIRPLFEYCHVAWGGNISASLKEKIRCCERQALRTALRVPSWTPSTYVYEKTGVEQIDSRLAKMMAKYAVKL